MSFLRRKLRCFYCGQSSGQSWRPGLASFLCKSCEATNYLDKNGEITDPPVSKVAALDSSLSFAHPASISRSTSPGLASLGTGANFCHTCTSNQQFVTQALAEYLPPPSDPRYTEYEKNLPFYRRQLEARYPQVCSDCEPLVKAQIRAAGYTARTDYIRRMNDKSRRGSIKSAWFTKRRLLGIVAGLVWLGVSIWNIGFNALGLLTIDPDGLRSDENMTLAACFKQTFGLGEVDSMCLSRATPLMPYVLALNCIFFWWNPILLRDTRRARGVGEFYKLQALLLLLRVVSLYYLDSATHNVFNTSDMDPTRAIHGVMLMLNVVVSAVSIRTARPAPHLVVFHTEGQDEDDAVPSMAAKNEQLSERQVPFPAAQGSDPSTTFPIQHLGPQRPGSTPAPLTPMANSTVNQAGFNDSTDAMDIDTPDDQRSKMGQVNLYRDSPGPTTRSRVRGVEFKPPVPLNSMSNRTQRGKLAKTRAQPRRTNSRTSTWDTESVTTFADDDAKTWVTEDGSEDDGQSALIPQSTKGKRNYHFQQATLPTKEEDTGLESMLGFFGLHNDPLREGMASSAQYPLSAGFENSEAPGFTTRAIPGLTRAKHIGAMPESSPSSRTNTLLLTVTTFAIVAGTVFSIRMDGEGLLAWTEHLRLGLLAWSASTGIIRLMEALQPRRQMWELSSALMFATEAVLGVLLTLARTQELRQAQGLASGVLDATATGSSDPTAAVLSPDDSDNVGLGGGFPDVRSKTGIGGDDDPLAGAQVDIVALTTGLIAWTLLQEAILLAKSLFAGQRDGVTASRQ